MDLQNSSLSLVSSFSLEPYRRSKLPGAAFAFKLSVEFTRESADKDDRNVVIDQGIFGDHGTYDAAKNVYILNTFVKWLQGIKDTLNGVTIRVDPGKTASGMTIYHTHFVVTLDHTDNWPPETGKFSVGNAAGPVMRLIVTGDPVPKPGDLHDAFKAC